MDLSALDDSEFDEHASKYLCCCGEMHSRTGTLLLGYGGVIMSVAVPLYLHLFYDARTLLYVSLGVGICVSLCSLVLLVAVYTESPRLLAPPICATIVWFLLTILCAVAFALWIAVERRTATDAILNIISEHVDRKPSKTSMLLTSTSTTTPANTVDDEPDSVEQITRTPIQHDTELARRMRAWRVVLVFGSLSGIAVPCLFTLITFKRFLVDKENGEKERDLEIRRKQSAEDHKKLRLT